MFHKSFMGLPYYRMEAAFEQLGARLPRETLANWCIITSQEYLYPIYQRLHKKLIKRDSIHADETTCQVLREEGKTPSPPPICGCIGVVPMDLRVLSCRNTSRDEVEHIQGSFWKVSMDYCNVMGIRATTK